VTTNNNLKLMIPGPIPVEESVLEVMGSPVQAHYGPRWVEIYTNTISMLRQVFNTHGDVFLMVGSGSCGLDACLGSAFSSGEKVLIGVNGFFGERLQHIAEGYNLEIVPVLAEWGKPLHPPDFEAALANHPDAKGMIVVHLETSTTVINPIQEIGQIADRHGVLFMVDTVSSLAGMPVFMDQWHIDLCVSASQKCLGAPPGLSPIAVSGKGWQVIDRNPAKGHGWYSDLRVWRQYAIDWADWHPYPVTLATSNILALRKSLQNLLKEGIENRMERFQSQAVRLRKGLRAIAMPPYTDDPEMAPVITAAYGPPGIPTGQLISYLEEQHQIKIAGGLGALKDIIFRIGHMSPAISNSDIDETLNALAEAAKKLKP
jgi:alanine-glyoxylate transaminase / serine-glyoxylate transaminase / serine-pyruvate transaminase